MTSDEQARRLREQLDRELAGVRSRPGDLEDVLERGRREHRSRGPVPWLAAAAAVLVVAVAVPVGVQQLDRRPDRNDGYAAPATPTPLALPTPSAAQPTVSPTPTTAPPPVSTPSRRPTSSSPGRSRTPSATPSPTPPATTATSTACAGPGPAIGKPRAAVDVDGDGAGDAVSATDGLLSVQLSTGGGGTEPLVAGEHVQAVMPVEADGSPGRELLVLVDGTIDGGASDGLRAELYDLTDCRLTAVLNAQGKGYWFEVGTSRSDTRRYAVSCSGGALLGVTSSRDTPDGPWTVTSRPVGVAGGVARSGAPTTTTVPAGDAAADALEQASCGATTPSPLG